MHSNPKIRLIDWYMKIDTPKWNTVDFECMKIPVDDDNQID